MNKKKLLISSLVGVACVIVCGLVWFTTQAFADTTNLLQKAALSGLYQCYVNGAYKDLTVSDYLTSNSIVSNADANTIYLPTGYSSVDKVDCSQVLSGAGNFAGLYAIANITPPISTSDISARTEFLKDVMGYTVFETESGGCVSYTYSRSVSGGSGTSNGGSDVTTFCIRYASGTGDNATINPSTATVSYSHSVPGGTTTNSFSDAIRFQITDNKATCQKPTVNILGVVSYENIATVSINNSQTWGDLKNALLSNGCAPEKITYYMADTYYTYSRSSITFPSYGATSAEFKITNKETAANNAIRALSGYSSYSQLSLSASEKRTLLQGYLDDYYKMSTRCGISGTEASIAIGDGYTGPYSIIDNSGTIQKCYVKATQNLGENVYVYNGDGYLGSYSWTDFKGVLGMLGYQLDEVYPEEQKEACNSKALSSRHAAQNLLNQSTTSKEYRDKAQKTINELDDIVRKTLGLSSNANVKGVPEEEHIYWYEDEATGQIMCYKYTDVGGQTSDQDPNKPIVDDNKNDSNLIKENEDLSTCKKASSLGWVLCPALKLIGDAAVGLYDSMTDSWLSVNKDEISTASALYDAWKGFRDYANIGFAIVFAIVVFSQVTGIGLSNYSIKKMLPTLIMVAVLVNISFFICQLAVDVTNIVANSIGNVLDGIGAKAGSNVNIAGLSTAKSVMANVFSFAGIGLGVGLTIANPIGTGFAIVQALIPVLISGIGALIGYFFLLILLAVRKAIIYVEVLLAPLAFICYALPNTKSLFDKWKKLFISLLLVFPICQVLVHGGMMMSNIMIAQGNNSFFFQLTAMLLQIVPIFFIPMVLRNSMSMLGNIGARIAQMGAKTSGWTTGKFRNANLTKRAQTALTGWAANKYAGSGYMQRKPKTALGAALQKNGRAKIAGALTQAEDLRQSDNRSKNIASLGFMGSLAASADLKADEEFGDNFVAGLMNGSIEKPGGGRYDMNDLRSVDHDGVDGDIVQLYSQLLNSDDKDDVKRLKGLTKHLLNIKGGKGLAAIAASMRRRGGAVFNDDGSMRSVNDKERRTFNQIARYATNNEKWNMMVKRWDPNMTALLNDGAMDSDSKVTNRGTEAWAHYNVGASGNSTPVQMINHDDSYFDGLRNVFGSEAGFEALRAQGEVGDSLRASIASYQNNAQEVFDNPRVYSQAGGALRDIQKVSNASQAYSETVSRLDKEIRDNQERHKYAEIREQVEKELKRKGYQQMGPRTSMAVDHSKKTARDRYNDDWGYDLD